MRKQVNVEIAASKKNKIMDNDLVGYENFLTIAHKWIRAVKVMVQVVNYFLYAITPVIK